MTPDKEHAPALMQQAADEAGELVAWLRRDVRDAAVRLVNGAFRRDGEYLADGMRPRFSIPARLQYDDDLVVTGALALAADTIANLMTRLAAAEDRELCAAAVAISLEKDLAVAEAKVGERLWRRLRDLQRRSFILTPEGNGVRAVKDSSGAWLSYYEAAQLIDNVKMAEIETPAPTYERGVTAGLEMSAKVMDSERLRQAVCRVIERSVMRHGADELSLLGTMDDAERILRLVKMGRASAIRALADRHKPSPAEEPMP